MGILLEHYVFRYENICEIQFLQEVNFVNLYLHEIYALDIAHSFCFTINLLCVSVSTI